MRVEERHYSADGHVEVVVYRDDGAVIATVEVKPGDRGELGAFDAFDVTTAVRTMQDPAVMEGHTDRAYVIKAR